MKEGICTCGHSKDMHTNTGQFNDGEVPPKRELDEKCRTDRDGVCGCEKYTQEKQ